MLKADLYEKFWSSFFALPESKISIHSNAKPTDRGSVCLGYENGLSYWHKIKGEQSHTVLYISRPTKSANKQIFHELLKHRNEIESLFGGSLVWEELKDKLPCRIYYEIEVGELEYKEDKWKEIQIKMINAMIRFQNQLSPYIEKYA